MITTAQAKALKLIFGAAALTVSVGVAQFAAGSDLRQSRSDAQLAAQQPVSLPSPMVAVNRSAKADRAVIGTTTPGLTFAVHPIDQNGSSFLVRIPAPLIGEALRPAVQPAQAPLGKPMVACEPVVSVLTDVAKLLQPGRCVT
jgi:hypothetical protein